MRSPEWSRWGPERLVSPDLIGAFAEITGNHQWVHKPEAEGKKPYGRQIAHGLLLVSLIPALLPDDGEFPAHTVRIIRGIEHLRLPSPVYPQEIVRARTKRIAARPAQSGKGVVIEREVEVWSTTGKKPAVSCILKLQYF